MDDAGVADEVIDVMVAFSFPEKFKVTRSAGASSWGGFDSGGLEWGGVGVTAEYAWPWYLNPYYSYVGFPYWGVGGDYYYPGWGVEVGGGDGTVVPAEPHGRVVNGRGYTQVLRAPEGGGQPTPRFWRQHLLGQRLRRRIVFRRDIQRHFRWLLERWRRRRLRTHGRAAVAEISI